MPRKPITPENAYLRLATLCARSEQAEGDLRKKLHDWGITENDSNDIIARLKQERYLDNERYARAYCRDKLRFNGWGRIKIAFMLRSKGIEQEYINTALAEIDGEEYAKILEQALISKAKTLIGKKDDNISASLWRFASSRGFEASDISRALSQITCSNYED